MPDEYQILSIGGLLHNFYSGVERIFERIAARLDGDVPGGQAGTLTSCVGWNTLGEPRALPPSTTP